MRFGFPLCIVLATFITPAFAQQKDLKGWQYLDPKTDGYNGISLLQAYQFLNGKKPKPVVVAVIDSGVDTAHEDLKNILWHNPKEIPGNGIDDDHNGYVDDVYGWNFLGNKNGQNLVKDVDERTRVYYDFKDKFSGKNVDTSSMDLLAERAIYHMAKSLAGDAAQRRRPDGAEHDRNGDEDDDEERWCAA